MPNIKRFGYKIGIKFNNTPLVMDKNNFTTKMVSAYIVYDIDNWPEIRIRNFTLKNCLYGATSLEKNSDKEKWVYFGYGISIRWKRYVGFC